MMFWITSPWRLSGRTLLLAVCAACLGLCLSACGSKQSMASGQSEEQTGTVHNNAVKAAGPAHLVGEEEGVDKADLASRTMSQAARDRAAQLPSGSTRSGAGKLNQVKTVAGDTLMKIAARKDVYGSGWLYPLIYEANKGLIKDPNNLPAGLVLKVPRDIPDPEVEMAKEEAMTGQILEKPAAAPAVRFAAAARVEAPLPQAPAKPGSRGAGSHIGWIAVAAALAAAAGLAWARLRTDEAKAPA